MNIAVFCSSSNHIATYYHQVASRLGEYIASKGNTLVYGGATGGLMDAVAQGAHSKGGKIIGVIPQSILKMNRQSSLPTEFITALNLSERKQIIKEISHLFIALPGGYGTLDEMFDVIASGITGEHHKPLIIVNEQHFFDLLIEQIKRMKNEFFIPENESYQPYMVENLEECTAIIDSIY
jgi:uncharacterized protein (TIGR00730 family)